MKRICLSSGSIGSLVLVFLAGCGESAPRTHLQGKVTYQGQPVADQTLVLYSSRAQGQFFTHKVPIGADGSFEGQGPPPGEYFVVIEESLAAQEGRQAASGKNVKIPPKYRQISTTDLTWKLQNGENKREIQLSD